MSVCLDENTALDLLDGKLSSAIRAPIERHLEGCDACRELVAELAKDLRLDRRLRFAFLALRVVTFTAAMR
jgi:anti-sigma factor RsiW